MSLHREDLIWDVRASDQECQRFSFAVTDVSAIHKKGRVQRLQLEAEKPGYIRDGHSATKYDCDLPVHKRIDGRANLLFICGKPARLKTTNTT
jgi:hypothetical protein